VNNFWYISYTKDMRGVYCDGCFNAKSSPYGWGFVCDEAGVDLISGYDGSIKVDTPTGQRTCLPVFDQSVKNQNNFAELVAFTVGLKLAMQQKISLIYSDSMLIIKYWSRGHVTEKTTKKMSASKQEWIKCCVALRKAFEESGGQVKFVRGAENIADPGWHC